MGTVQVIPGEPGQLSVHFPYSSERVAAIRSVPGRLWHPQEKYWTVPHTPETLEQMRRVFSSDRVVVAAAATGLSVEQIRTIIEMLDQELALRGYSPKTRDDYRLQAQRFLKWLQRDPSTAGKEDLRAYLLDILDSGLSTSYARQAHAVLMILYTSVLKQPEKCQGLPSVKRDKPLPLVLSREQVQRLLKATASISKSDPRKP